MYVVTESLLRSEFSIKKFYSRLNLTVYWEENIPFYTAPKHIYKENDEKTKASKRTY